MGANTKRDIWVDNVKVVACVLVVLGHFYQSMVKANILADTFFYEWFDDTIYYFHVPLFFICSGFLYQKYSNVRDGNTWWNNITKKFLALGVPYFIFSFATWMLKKVFSSSVNDQLGSLVDTLFNHPASPYWYLYVLFFMFVITFTTTNIKQQAIYVAISVTLRLLYCAGMFSAFSSIYIVDKLLVHWVWFVLGMALTYDVRKLTNIVVGTVMFIFFLVSTVLVRMGFIQGSLARFALAVIACYSILCIVHSFFKNGVQNKSWQFCAKYTMPVFLMHTLFAAPLRSVLMKAGITNSVIHIVLGLVISFCGPVVAMMLLERLKPLDFIIYPTRYIKLGKRS